MLLLKKWKRTCWYSYRYCQRGYFKELENNSSKIAYALAKDLINELKGAGSIEIKVNSIDYNYLKEHFSENSHIKITLDDAISKGSVIILSDSGNIESNLNARLIKIKKMVNNEWNN